MTIITFNKKLIFHFLFRHIADKSNSITSTSKKGSKENDKGEKLKVKKNLVSIKNSTQEKKRKLNNPKESKVVKKIKKSLK